MQVLDFNFLKIQLNRVLPVHNLSSEFFSFWLKVTVLFSLCNLPCQERKIKLVWNQQTSYYTDIIPFFPIRYELISIEFRAVAEASVLG